MMNKPILEYDPLVKDYEAIEVTKKIIKSYRATFRQSVFSSVVALVVIILKYLEWNKSDTVFFIILLSLFTWIKICLAIHCYDKKEHYKKQLILDELLGPDHRN